ncbi:rRNA maturation RNase YbeY [Rhodobacteraceae bacterium WD3A24]|nr:rRNA maturation RNase YbeY [Rhodobacteraceae bacterium WD3A24]
MALLVDTIIEDDRWRRIGLEALAVRAAEAALRHLGLDPDGYEIALLAADDARLAELNAAFRGRSGATNVLSWPAHELAPATPGARPAAPPDGSAEWPESLGDIALAFGTCAAEATAQRRRLEDHAAHLVVHGVLHLLGYDHVRDPDAALMERTETVILAQLGIADPYRDGAVEPG